MLGGRVMNNLLSRLWRKNDGVAMIEFALVAPIFLLLLMGGLEYGIITFISGTLGTIVNEAGRLGMTGGNYADLQDPNSPPLPRDEFLRQRIAERMGPLMGMGELEITPVPYASLSGIGVSGNAGSPGFGGGGQIVVYDVDFTWDIMTPLMSSFMGHDGKYVINARTVIQNEEF